MDGSELREAVTRVNEAGKLILEIWKERNLFVANTVFDHKQIHMGAR